jgi:hypothetical protein
VEIAFGRRLASSFDNFSLYIHYQKIRRLEKSQCRTVGSADKLLRPQAHAYVTAPADNQPFLMGRPPHLGDVITAFLYEVRIHSWTLFFSFQFAVDSSQLIKLVGAALAAKDESRSQNSEVSSQ